MGNSIQIAHARARYYPSYIGAQRDRDGTLIEPAVGTRESPPVLVHLRSGENRGSELSITNRQFSSLSIAGLGAVLHPRHLNRHGEARSELEVCERTHL